MAPQTPPTTADPAQQMVPPPPYGYWPSLAVGILFVIFFSLCMFAHMIQFWRFKKLTSVLLATGALVEVIGWAARLWSAKTPYNTDAFLMQLTTLILAPTFFSAALYFMLGQMIKVLGRRSSVLRPMTCFIVFCICDLLSLVIQAIGGGMAAIAQKRSEDTKPGTDIMVAGIDFQMGSMALFTFFFSDFIYRTIRHVGLPRQCRGPIACMAVSVAMIFARSIYRTIELSQGWRGYLITRESYFIGLDAVTMVIACGIFFLSDPACHILRSAEEAADTEKDHEEEIEDSGHFGRMRFGHLGGEKSNEAM